jgi:pyruvate dehydrogenase E1 component alpha subunit
MPREEIDLPYRVDYLSILDQDGNLDKDLEPELAAERLLWLHRAMLLGRRFDERMLRLQRQGRIGTFAPILGQEAAQIGAVAPLRDSDWLVPAFREAAAELMRGRSMENILLAFGGFNPASSAAKASNNLPIAVPVGSQILHAVGLAYGIKYRKKDDVVMVFFGDGATSEGDFHEGLNFAGVFQTPTIFVCQNNGWAISYPRSKQSRSKTLAQKSLAYGIPAIQVDGNDLLAVYAAAKEAVDRARAGGGPSMIECVTYRLSVHTTADDPKRYRSDQDVEMWEKRDPIPRFQQYLKDKGLLSDEKLQEIEGEIAAEIQAAVDRAEQQMGELGGEALSMFEHMYAEMPPYLQAQRDELIQEFSRSKEASHG